MSPTISTQPQPQTLAIIYSPGAFGDCARHSILSALSNPGVSKIKVFSSSLTTLEASNWKCGCKQDHGEEMKESPYLEKIELVHVDDITKVGLDGKYNLDGVDAVIAGIGNRQPFLGHRVGKAGAHRIVMLMKESNVKRLVMMTSTGISSNVSNDKPCMEWRGIGKVMGILFKTLCRREYNDLVGLENAVDSSDVDFMLVRPTGLGEDVIPVGECFIQKKKYEDVLGLSLAKADVGALMVEEALCSTISKTAVVVGGNPQQAYDKL